MCTGCKKSNKALEELVQQATEEKAKQIAEIIALKTEELESNKIINKTNTEINE